MGAKLSLGDVPQALDEMSDELRAKREASLTYNEFLSTAYFREMLRRLQYYEGNQFVQDTSLLSEYSVITPKTWKASISGPGWIDICAMIPEATENAIVQPVGVPFTKIVIDNQMVVYTVPPKERNILVNEQPKEEASKLLSKIYNACDHDLLADQFCKWVGLFGTSFQFITFDKRKKSIVKRNLAPYSVFVLPSEEAPTDLQHPDCLVAIAQIPSSLTKLDEDETVWQVWWKDEYWYETREGFEYTNAALTNPGRNKNPYRDAEGGPVKPILVMQTQPTTDIYFPGSDLLIQLNQRLDRNMTAISHTMEYQGFAIPVVTGATPEEVESQPWSAGALFILQSENANLGFAHPAAPIGELLGAIVKQARAFARLLSIDPELVDPESKIQSGVSRAQARLVLAERREEQFPKWLPYERESYWLTSIVWNTHVSKSNKQLPVVSRFENPIDDDNFKLQVVFGELDPVVDPLADVLTKAKRIEANLNDRAEIIAAERRIDINQAKLVAERIAETNAKEEEEKLKLQSKYNVKAKKTDDRTGQSGNRPQEENQQPARKGGSTTSQSGNNPIAT